MQGCIYQACKHLHVPLPTWWTSSGYSVIFTQARKISDYVDHGPRRPRPEQLCRAPTTSTTDRVDHVPSGSAELRPHRPPDHVAMMIAAKNGATTTATTVMTTCWKARGPDNFIATRLPAVGDIASRLHATGNSHTVGDILSHLDLATRLIPRLPASSGTTSVRCTCRCILYRLYDGWILNLTGNSF